MAWLTNWQVRSDSAGEQGMALYLQRQPDVVMMDFKLPGISGTEATKVIC